MSLGCFAMEPSILLYVICVIIFPPEVFLKKGFFWISVSVWKWYRILPWYHSKHNNTSLVLALKIAPFAVIPGSRVRMGGRGRDLLSPSSRKLTPQRAVSACLLLSSCQPSPLLQPGCMDEAGAILPESIELAASSPWAKCQWQFLAATSTICDYGSVCKWVME